MEHERELVQERTEDDTDTPPGEAVSGRRSLLRSMAIGAAAGVAGVAVVGRQAAAADGEPLPVGATEDHTSPTNVNYLGPTTAASFNVQSGDQTAANEGILNGAFGSAGSGGVVF